MATAPTGSSRSASAWALHQILDLIENGELSPGARLPPERDLALRLGVSRGSAREAISALVTMGILETRHGAGVFVTSLDAVSMLASVVPAMGLLNKQHPGEVARLHTQIASSTAARAAAHATAEGLGALEQALSELRLAAGEPRPRAARDRFNRTIARISVDRFHRALARMAMDPVAEGMLVLLRGARESGSAVPMVIDVSLYERLVRAVSNGEVDEARTIAAMLVLDEAYSSAENTAAVSFTTTRTEAFAATEPAQRDHRREVESTDRADIDGPDASAYPGWFRDAKFGVILHWGVYSIPGWAPRPPEAGTVLHSGEDESPIAYFAEWYQAAASVPGSPTAVYHQRVHGDRPYSAFRPAYEAAAAGWSPESWARALAGSGVRYVVQVAKHHDGFLLWPSRVRHPRDQSWHSSRDVVGELASAVRSHGMRFGIFYSSGADWSFGNTPVTSADDIATSHPPGADYARYVEAHWRELISAYLPDGLWNDTGYPAEGDARRLISEYRSRVPEGVVTDRFRASHLGQVLREPNQPWESVRPVGLSFGWNRQEMADDVMSGPELVCMLLDVVADNGNLLLGVSPDDRGQIPAQQLTTLEFLGHWLEQFGPSIYGTRPWGPRSLATPNGTIWFTRDEEHLYVFFEGSADLELTGITLPDESVVTRFGTDERIKHESTPQGARLQIPSASHADSPVVVLTVTPVPDFS